MDTDSVVATSVDVVSWTLFSCAACLGTLRYHARYNKHGSLLPDDWAHLFALSQAFIYSFLQSAIAQIEGTDLALGPDFFALSTATSILSFTTIYASKVVFLTLYRQIFGVSKKFMIAWWMTAFILLVSFVICVLGIFTNCSVNISDFSMSTCLDTWNSNAVSIDALPSYIEWRRALMSMIPNVLTDLLLMILPCFMLAKSPMDWKRKLKLIPVFLLTLFVIVIDMINWITYGAQATTSPSLSIASTLFSYMEPPLCVIISALPPLLHMRRRQPRGAVHGDLPREPQTVEAKTLEEQGPGEKLSPGYPPAYHGRPTMRDDIETALSAGSDLHIESIARNDSLVPLVHRVESFTTN